MDETLSDLLTAGLAARYAATFDRTVRATGPQGIHWCLTTPAVATEELGVDGHPVRTEHPDLPRRMWASSEVEFHAPIAIGASVERTSRIVDSTRKSGRSGPLLFTTVAHRIHADGVLAIQERQSIVYRAFPAFDVSSPAPLIPAQPPMLPEGTWDWERRVTPTPLLLFRYSALTFNSHRIHYDLPYALTDEAYPGLVVQGPLMASLLLDLVDRALGPEALSHFAFRAIHPASVGAPLRLLGRSAGDEVMLAVAGTDGTLHVSASGRRVENGSTRTFAQDASPGMAMPGHQLMPPASLNDGCAVTEHKIARPVLVERHGHVMLITINRPEARNAVNEAVHEGIGQALEEAQADPHVRCVIITGAGDQAFCAGADLKALSQGESIVPADPIKAAWGFAGIVNHPITKPIIACVNGDALGGGLEIALACDIVVALDTARFGLPEPKRGLFAAAGGVFRLPRHLPKKVAMEMILTGEPILAEHALSLGLVNRLSPRVTLMETARDIADRIAANAPLAVQWSKQVAEGVQDGSLPGEVPFWEANRIAVEVVFKSDDMREGTRAFAEKRLPVWKAR